MRNIVKILVFIISVSLSTLLQCELIKTSKNTFFHKNDKLDKSEKGRKVIFSGYSDPGKVSEKLRTACHNNEEEIEHDTTMDVDIIYVAVIKFTTPIIPTYNWDNYKGKIGYIIVSSNGRIYLKFQAIMVVSKVSSTLNQLPIGLTFQASGSNLFYAGNHQDVESNLKKFKDAPITEEKKLFWLTFDISEIVMNSEVLWMTENNALMVNPTALFAEYSILEAAYFKAFD